MKDPTAIPQVQASDVIEDLVRAWAAGDGAAFARPFADEGWFVAFDGTVLRGPAEIGAFHQEAFSTHLSGNRLEVQVDEIRALAAGVVVALTRGGIWRGDDGQGALTGASIQTYTMRAVDGRLQIESFQNTRERPIRGPQAAQIGPERQRSTAGVDLVKGLASRVAGGERDVARRMPVLCGEPKRERLLE